MLDKKARSLEAVLATTSDNENTAQGILMSIQSLCAKGGLGANGTELASLDDVAGRVLAEDIAAGCDAPIFDESMRDGYALGFLDLETNSSDHTFSLVGETGAGDGLTCSLDAGTTWKVMTGGKVPDNCSRVIPQEWCRISGRSVTIEAQYLRGKPFVGRKGSQHTVGEVLVRSGEVITPALLVKIADAGRTHVKVYARPRVCFCCTGKELVGAGVVPGDAQKISSNQYLLGALLRQYGCTVHNYGIVGDEEQLVAEFFNHSLHNKFDLVLTTGGTGGGDFDLVESGFVGAGGTVTCNSLNMRPGKSTVIGRKGDTLYIGLPGPPAAAHTVFLELVVPVLMQMKGVESDCNEVISAVAAEEITVKTRGHLVIKEGVTECLEGVLQLRLAGKKQSATCNILIPPGKDCILKGDVVEVHMREPLWLNS